MEIHFGLTTSPLLPTQPNVNILKILSWSICQSPISCSNFSSLMSKILRYLTPPLGAVTLIWSRMGNPSLFQLRTVVWDLKGPVLIPALLVSAGDQRSMRPKGEHYPQKANFPSMFFSHLIFIDLFILDNLLIEAWFYGASMSPK